MEDNGEEKLISVVRHLVKTLGRTDTMTEDMLQVFSAFDNRISLERLSGDKPSPKLSPDALPASPGDDGSHRRKAAAPAPSLKSIQRTIRSLDRQICHFVASDRHIWSDSADAAAFLEAVDDLLDTIRELDPPSPTQKPLLDRADDLLQRCMLRLDEEFRAIVERPDGAGLPAPPPVGPSPPSDESDGDDDSDDDPVPVAHPVDSYDIIIDALPPGSVADLHAIARRMVAAGFGCECAETYAVSRREFVDESVARLGLRFRTPDEVHATSWADLEDEIPRWIKALNMVFLILIPSERRLCDRVFASLPHFADLAFAQVCRPAAVAILSFAEAIAAGAHTPERLFRVIDMYEAVRDILPDLDPLFADQYSASLRAKVRAVYKALGGSIRAIFMELENLIRRDPAKAAVPGGGLHPITRYVMNYLRAACASRRTLEEVMEDDAGAAAGSTDPHRLSSPLSVQLDWIMDVLQRNLEAKSKIYREPALCCIFLMNNGRYIIQKVKDSELNELLGEAWIRRQTSLVRRWVNEYQRTTWNKVLAALRADSTGGGGALLAGGKDLKERLRMFYHYLDEIWKVQGGWVVPDEQQRTELRSNIQELVVPAYRNFVGRLRQTPDAARQAERYQKYTPEEVEAKINELFEGSTVAQRII